MPASNDSRVRVDALLVALEALLDPPRPVEQVKNGVAVQILELQIVLWGFHDSGCLHAAPARSARDRDGLWIAVGRLA